MKRIVSILLAVVLALSLTVTAFADTTATSYGSTQKLNDGWYVVLDGEKVTGIEVTSFTEMSVREVTSGKDVTKTYIPAFYEATGLGEDEVLYDCVKECADYGMYHNGKFVCYVNVDYAPDTLGFLDNATFIAGSKSGKCGTFANDVYVVDGKAYLGVSHGGEKACLNGKFMQYDNEQFAVEHKFEMSNVTYKGVDGDDAKIPVKVKCSKCGNKFDIVSSIPKDYLGKVNTEFFAGYYVLLGNETVVEEVKVEETKKEVNSAKTFDMGILPYAGLCLASAGGAFAVGKKKDEDWA